MLGDVWDCQKCETISEEQYAKLENRTNFVWACTSYQWRLDIKVRKLLTMNKVHQPKADVDMLYIRRSEGEKGLLQLESLYKTLTIGLQTYLDSTQDWMLQLVNRHEKTKQIHSASCQSKNFMTELELAPIEMSETQPIKRANIVNRRQKRKD